jgi:hypothetical protein
LTQAQRPTEREHGRQGLVGDLGFSLFDPLGQHDLLFTVQKRDRFHITEIGNDGVSRRTQGVIVVAAVQLNII